MLEFDEVFSSQLFGPLITRILGVGILDSPNSEAPVSILYLYNMITVIVTSTVTIIVFYKFTNLQIALNH